MTPRISPGDTGMGVSGHGRPRSPPPPTSSAKAKRESREKDHGHVEGYDLSSVASGDEGDRGTPSRAQVDEVPSGGGDTSDTDQRSLSHVHQHKFERVLRNFTLRWLLDGRGAAAAAYAAEVPLGLKGESWVGLGVDGDDNDFDSEDVGKEGPVWKDAGDVVDE